MSAPASPATNPIKSKLKLIVLGAVAFLLLAGAGAGGAWFYFGKQGAAYGPAQDAAAEPKQRVAPTYFALENLVINLADPGGERVAQIGITLDLESEKTIGQIKSMLPAIRSRVLVLASQRTSQELLKRDGKEKLADDIVQEVSLTLGYEVDEPVAPRKSAKTAEAGDDEPPVRRKRRAPPSPVHGVLFSSFIVQ